VRLSRAHNDFQPWLFAQMAAWQLSHEARQDFCRDGFVVIDACLPPDTLRAFEGECRALSHGVDLDDTDCVVDLWAPQALGDHHPARTDPAVYQALRSSAVAKAAEDIGPGVDGDAVLRVIFGGFASLATQAFSALLQEAAADLPVSDVGDKFGAPDTRLFNEHYVVKPAESAIEFGWHTDENEQLQMCLNKPVLPYVSLWVPLCDTSEDNGTLEILPRSAPQPPAGADKSHPFFEATSGKEDTTAVGASLCARRLAVRAGGVVLFASDVWHRSGANRSTSARQVFYAQYSCGVLRSDGTLACPRLATSEARSADFGEERVSGRRGRGECDSAAGPGASCSCEDGVCGGVKIRRLAGPLSFAVPVSRGC
jgi:hypothetical protein